MKYLAGIKKRWLFCIMLGTDRIKQRMHNTLHSTEDTKHHRQYRPLSASVWAITSAAYTVKSALLQKAMISSSNPPSIDQQLPLLRKKMLLWNQVPVKTAETIHQKEACSICWGDFACYESMAFLKSVELTQINHDHLVRSASEQKGLCFH